MFLLKIVVISILITSCSRNLTEQEVAVAYIKTLHSNTKEAMKFIKNPNEQGFKQHLKHNLDFLQFNDYQIRSIFSFKAIENKCSDKNNCIVKVEIMRPDLKDILKNFHEKQIFQKYNRIELTHKIKEELLNKRNKKEKIIKEIKLEKIKGSWKVIPQYPN